MAQRIAVVTDSNSGITQKLAKELGVFVLPMPFVINGETFFEDISLSQEAFYEKLQSDAAISTSQPAPGDILDLWDTLLQDHDAVVHIPMSSGLSGSCAAASALAAEYDGRVAVVNNQRISVTQRQSVMDAAALARAGKSAAEIKEVLEKVKFESSIYIMVDTLQYLKKGGRINTTTALAASLLNIKPVMKFGTGKLDVFQKCRGMKKSRKAMIDAMHRELETTFKKEYDAGKVYLMAASSSTAEVTADWISQIRESFPGMDVMCDDLSLGLSCHIGPDGLGIGCSCMPL